MKNSSQKSIQCSTKTKCRNWTTRTSTSTDTQLNLHWRRIRLLQSSRLLITLSSIRTIMFLHSCSGRTYPGWLIKELFSVVYLEASCSPLALISMNGHLVTKMAQSIVDLTMNPCLTWDTVTDSYSQSKDSKWMKKSKLLKKKRTQTNSKK